MDTVFSKIRDGIIPSTMLYKDDKCFVILDINPISKGHALVISNEPYANLQEIPEDVLQHLIVIAKKVEKKMIETLHCDGSNILENNNPASGQEIPHFHIHVIPRYNNDGQKFGFTHAKYDDGEITEFGKKLAL